MFDPGPSLLAVLVLGLGPADQPPGLLVEPSPAPGEACVQLLSALYLGGPLEPCPPTVTPRRTPPIVPLDLLGHSARDE